MAIAAGQNIVRWMGRLSPGALLNVASLVAGAGLWEVVARAWHVAFFPPLSSVLFRLAHLVADGEILGTLGASMINLAIGFAISAVVGVAVGLLMGLYQRIEQALDMYVYALMTAPSLVFAPIFFAIFGLGRAPVIGVIVMNSIFVIIVSASDAVHSVPGSLVDMARSFCAGDSLITRRIVVPAAMPLIMAGLRVGMVRAVKGMVAGELFIAVFGLGALIAQAGHRYDAKTVLAVLLVIIAVAFALMTLVRLADRRLNAWLPSTFRS